MKSGINFKNRNPLKEKFSPLWMNFALAAILLLTFSVFQGGLLPQAQAPTPTPTANVAPVNPAVQVSMNELYLNKLVSQAIQNEQGLSDAVVDLHQPNIADVTLTIRVAQQFQVRPTVTLEMFVVNNQVQMRVINTNFSGLRLPSQVVETSLSSLKNRMEMEINQQLVGQLNQTDLRLANVSSTENRLTIDLVEVTATPPAATAPTATPTPTNSINR